MPRPSVSSLAHAKRIQTDRVLRPLTEHVASSVSNPAAVPSALTINLLAWNGADVLGAPHRVGLHPRLGLHSWSTVVATVFSACGCGIGDGTLFTGSGLLVTSYDALLTAYVAEKTQHQRRWEYIATVERGAHDKWSGPFAPKAARGKDDAVERVFYFDVVCCARGQPFRTPRALVERLRRRHDVDGALQSADEAKRIEARKQNDAALAAANMSIVVRGKHHYEERPATVMASYVNLTKRRDIQLLIHSTTDLASSTSPHGSDGGSAAEELMMMMMDKEERSFSMERSSPACKPHRSMRPVNEELADHKDLPATDHRRLGTSGGQQQQQQQQLLQRMNTGLRRAVASAQLMREANTYGDRIVELRHDLLHVLRKEVVIEGALTGEEREAALHATVAAASAPLAVVPAAAATVSAHVTNAPLSVPTERCSSAAPRAEGQASPLRASATKHPRLLGSGGAGRRDAEQPDDSALLVSDASTPITRIPHVLRYDEEKGKVCRHSPLDDLSDHSAIASSQSSPTAAAAAGRGGRQPGTKCASSSSFPSSRVRELSATTSTPTGHISNVPFPLGVCRNRLGELIKLDGGPVKAGSLVTSSVTGELYQVEWVDVSRNLAHCRWVIRGSDPYLSSVVDCNENSFSHGLHYGEHFTKYRYHWFQRLELVNRITEGVTDNQPQQPHPQQRQDAGASGSPTSEGHHARPNHRSHEQQVAWNDDVDDGDDSVTDRTPPTKSTTSRKPVAVRPLIPTSALAQQLKKGDGSSPSWCRSDSFVGIGGAAPSDLDTSMLHYGELPASCKRLDVLSPYAHRASPVSQRRMQQNGLQIDDSDGGEDGDVDYGGMAQNGGDGERMPNDDDIQTSRGYRPAPHRSDLRNLSSREIALIKDFEVLFPATTRDRKNYAALAEEVLRCMPKITSSSKVSFLTDVCCDVRLVHLKPTTTFRFLMWLDLGFVISATRLRRQYEALLLKHSSKQRAVAAERELVPMSPSLLSLPQCEHVPIPTEDLHHPCDAAFRFYNGGTLRSQTCETFDKVEPVEGCSSHDHDGLAELVSLGGEQRVRCFCCGRGSHSNTTDAAMSSAAVPALSGCMECGGGTPERHLAQGSGIATAPSPLQRLEVTMIL